MIGLIGCDPGFLIDKCNPMGKKSYHIHITGIVQGVGFRPFIYSLAKEYDLTGWVRNSASGVDIEITGRPDDLDKFMSEISNSAPPLSQIDTIDNWDIENQSFDTFKIIPSKDQANEFIPISPDVAICEQCQAELFDPHDRRFRYPFINCTNCGPRFSIIKDIPYDRPKTTMADFVLCHDCLAEYEDPMDRRFHAQPVACPVCGPQVWLESKSGQRLSERNEAIIEARLMLTEGKILAIKGLGGFHLACDATNPESVAKLRRRKTRPAKPFALMAFTIETVKEYVRLSPSAIGLLSSPQAPIVLLPAVPNSEIAPNVAPGQKNLGFMLPYTPLHLLLLEPAAGFPEVLVMTSGNLAEEPVIHENHVAREKLAGIADGFLIHNRPIHMRIDDSVYTIVNEQPYPIRRARGFAPNPIRLSHKVPQVLGAGPQMKNTFCLTRDRYAFLSHYIGEMENWETYRDYQNAIHHYETLYRINPLWIGYDLHPDYTSTRYALQRGEIENIPVKPIQHHHAHLAACMIEHDIPPQSKIGGLIFDGTGFGEDGTIWGGEVLIGNYSDYQRLYYLKPVPLPGGDVTVTKPARMALSTLWAYGLPWEDHLRPVEALSSQEKDILRAQLEKGINVPLTSSMGRLFDAVSALIGVRQEISYEAQAAIELEALADASEVGYYPWRLDGKLIDVKSTLEAILSDLANGTAPQVISARFHNTITNLSLDLAQRISRDYGIDQIALSGGVWQNQVLIEKVIERFKQHEIQPLVHRLTPTNDGCVAMGQALITAYRYSEIKE